MPCAVYFLCRFEFKCFKMKTVVLALIALVCLDFTGLAQSNAYTVKPGESANKALPADVQYHYPQFTQGTVFFRDGTASNATLDYNLLSGEMQFIAPKGDTMAVSNEATIKYILIDSDTFFYDKTFLKLIDGNATAKLAQKEVLVIGDVKKSGGYGLLSSSSSITTISSINSNGRVTKLTENKQIILSKKVTYYIGDAYNHFLPTSKKNIIKLFGKKQAAIEQYFKDNKVLFNNEEDLKALIKFLQI